MNGRKRARVEELSPAPGGAEEATQSEEAPTQTSEAAAGGAVPPMSALPEDFAEGFLERGDKCDATEEEITSKEVCSMHGIPREGGCGTGGVTAAFLYRDHCSTIAVCAMCAHTLHHMSRRSSCLYSAANCVCVWEVHIKSAVNPNIDLCVTAFADGAEFTTEDGALHHRGDSYHVMVRRHSVTDTSGGPAASISGVCVRWWGLAHCVGAYPGRSRWTSPC